MHGTLGQARVVGKPSLCSRDRWLPKNEDVDLDVSASRLARWLIVKSDPVGAGDSARNDSRGGLSELVYGESEPVELAQTGDFPVRRLISQNQNFARLHVRLPVGRSEERRVGKECRYRGWTCSCKEKLESE